MIPVLQIKKLGLERLSNLLMEELPAIIKEKEQEGQMKNIPPQAEWGIQGEVKRGLALRYSLSKNYLALFHLYKIYPLAPISEALLTTCFGTP